MHWSLLFLITIIISYVASLQPAPLNLLVFKTNIDYGKKNALWVAFGGVFPEFIYCFTCVLLIQTKWFTDNVLWMRLAVPILLFSMAWNTFRKKKETGKVKTFTLPYFWKGLFTGASNPMLPIFWFGMLTSIASYFNINSFTFTETLLCAFGASIGEFVLLLHYISISNKIAKVLNKSGNRMNIFLGWTFIVVACAESIHLLYLIFFHGK